MPPSYRSFPDAGLLGTSPIDRRTAALRHSARAIRAASTTERMESKPMSINPITTGTERAIIENMLDHNREALIETVRGLSDADARRRLVASLTTPISLIKHAAAAERIWFQRFWAGLDETECDGYSRRDECTFVVTADESLADVIAEFERASQRSRAIASR